jgi:hypothetical protein
MNSPVPASGHDGHHAGLQQFGIIFGSDVGGGDADGGAEARRDIV